MLIEEAEIVLGLNGTYDKKVFHKVYHKAVLANHPDVGGDQTKMIEINDAKAVLDEYFATHATRVAGAITDFTPTSPEPFRKKPQSSQTDIMSPDEIKEEAKKRESEPENSPSEMSERERKAEEWGDAIEKRTPFKVGDKTYRFAPLSLSIPARILTFFVLMALLTIYGGGATFDSMYASIDLVFTLFYGLIFNLIVCGWVSRRILRLFRVFVRTKDALKFCLRQLDKIPD